MLFPDVPLALAPLSTLAPALDGPTAESMPVGIQEVAFLSEAPTQIGMGREGLIWRVGLDSSLEAAVGLGRMRSQEEATGRARPLDSLDAYGHPTAFGSLGWSPIPGLWKVAADVQLASDTLTARARLWNVLELVTPWGTPRLTGAIVDGAGRVSVGWDAPVVGACVIGASVVRVQRDDLPWWLDAGVRCRPLGDVAISAGLQVATGVVLPSLGLSGRW